jgi:hypothetical protein
MSNFMKILSVGAKLFLAGGQTDRQADKSKLTIAFLNFAKASKEHSKETKLSENKVRSTKACIQSSLRSSFCRSEGRNILHSILQGRILYSQHCNYVES